jgi:hypothetical protein
LEDVDLNDVKLLSNKMEINLHMLSALMLDGVGGEVHDIDVVMVDKGALRRQTLELMEQLVQPGGLNDVIGDRAIISLRARSGDDRLSFGQPGKHVVPQEHCVAGCRAACVWTASPVSISVDDEIRAG